MSRTLDAWEKREIRNNERSPEYYRNLFKKEIPDYEVEITPEETPEYNPEDYEFI